MGGSGSGSWYRWDAKLITENQDRIDIRWLKKHNYLHPGSMGSLSWSCGGEETGSIGFQMKEDRMVLNYRHRHPDGEWEDVEQIVPVIKTPCNYGGYRKWFLCPKCSRRVGILYGTGKYFLCRHCYDLTYTCSNASPLKRIFDRTEKLRRKLGGDNDPFLSPIPERPRGMHRSTYKKIADELRRLENFGNDWMYSKYGLQF